jgi:hypothetical protein
MRVTLTLEHDVARLAERARQRLGGTLEDIANAALRKGLRQLEAPRRPPERFRTTGVSLGSCPLPGGVDQVARAAAAAEGDDLG